MLPIQNYEEESFHLVRENKKILQQLELEKPEKSVVTQPSNVSINTLYGSLTRQACLVYLNQQFALDNKLLTHPKAAYTDRREAVGSKHYIAIHGRRY